MANLRTPLYDRHVAVHAKMVEFGGWDMPVQYTGILDEHTAVRKDVGMFDISHMGRLSFAGADSLDLIQQVYTNNASTMKDGQVRYGLICNDHGGILDDVLVYRWPYGWAMVVNASNRTKIVAWLEQHKGARNVKIIDQTMDTAMIAVQGPRAVEICRDLTDFDPSQLKYYFAAPTRFQGADCVISRTGYTGEDGFEIMVGSAKAGTLWDELLRRGAKPCGLGARDTLRLEAAMPLYGHELSESIDPISAGLNWAVKMEKGPFIGRHSLMATLDPRQPTRVGLELDGKRAAREGCPVLYDGKTIGRVTSGSYGPTVQKSIAMAYVSRDAAALVTPVQVDIRGDKVPARIVKLPFYSRPK